MLIQNLNLTNTTSLILSCFHVMDVIHHTSFDKYDTISRLHAFDPVIHSVLMYFSWPKSQLIFKVQVKFIFLCAIFYKACHAFSPCLLLDIVIFFLYSHVFMPPLKQLSCSGYYRLDICI